MTYAEAKGLAQTRANATGQDYGLTKDHFGNWYPIGLPAKPHRYGYERRIEVVSCEDIDKCWPGHGPESTF